MLLLQAPEPDKSELSAEELQTVELFLQNTPSVVNIANIGEVPMHQLQGLKPSAAPSLLKLHLDAIFFGMQIRLSYKPFFHAQQAPPPGLQRPVYGRS